jgi:hypothetical protein
MCCPQRISSPIFFHNRPVTTLFTLALLLPKNKFLPPKLYVTLSFPLCLLYSHHTSPQNLTLTTTSHPVKLPQSIQTISQHIIYYTHFISPWPLSRLKKCIQYQLLLSKPKAINKQKQTNNRTKNDSHSTFFHLPLNDCHSALFRVTSRPTLL